LSGIDADGKVNGHYQRVKDAQQDDRANALSSLAQDALARVRAGQHKPGKARTRDAREAGSVKKYGVRAFAVTWAEMAGWTEHYDPADIGVALSVEQWTEFEDTLRATVRFADAALEARSS
jgi:ParB family chromosome partitioning protein